MAAAFLLVLWLPLADSFMSVDPSPPTTEGRQLARPPEFRLSTSYFAELWRSLRKYDDFFGFRNSLVRWNNTLDMELWHRKSLGSDVLGGREGWLYLAWPEALDEHRHANLLAAADLERLRVMLETRRDRLLAQGSLYLLVFVPDKETVYPEYYPSGFEEVADESRLDQVVRFLQERSDIPVVDLRGALVAAREIGQVYYRTDTHWNDLGALVGLREVARALKAALPRIQVPSLEEYNVVPATYAVGDLSGMLSLHDRLAEKTMRLQRRVPTPSTISAEGFGVPPDVRFLYSVVRQEPSELPRAVIVGDSFAGADRLAALLPACFSRCVFVRSYGFDGLVPSLIANEKPDVVIQEVVERYLGTITVYGP